jgi:hypothetical protein
MKNHWISAALLAFSAFAPTARAQCGTDTGRILDMPSTAAIGSHIDIKLDAPPPAEMAYLMFSLGQGPVDLGSYGTVCLDFPVLLGLVLTFDANGHVEIGGEVPCESGLIGLTLYAQFITCSPGNDRSSHGSSNQESITFTGGCSVDDSISSNFNGTDIDPGDTVWFNSVVDVKNLDGAEGVVHFKGSHVTFTADGIPYDVALPEAAIVFSASATDASSIYDPVANEWQTTVPASYSGNVFLTGAGLNVPAGLPGGINPVLWSGTFSSDTTGLQFQWKWAAAVYTAFNADLNALGVKPIDGDKNNPYDNADHAGTPEDYKGFVTGGARGGGGSNFTGSYSSTSTAECSGCQ